jgi:hypothetical protein
MKLAIPLLLAGLLALGPIGCNRNNSPDESVSANEDKTQRSDETAPKAIERRGDQTRPVERETEIGRILQLVIFRISNLIPFLLVWVRRFQSFEESLQ